MAETCRNVGWDLLLLHGLNPFGFAHSRRWDEENIDPNRNFLLPGETAEGVSEVYRHLDSLLNPTRPPSWHDPLSFYLRATAAVARHGFAKVKQAVAEGQYEFPQGLFFGGREPCWTQRTLADHLPGWVQRYESVVHLDIHSGLGRWGDCQLLLDYPVRDQQRQWLNERFGPGGWEDVDPSGDAYNARGGLGRWCQQQFASQQYTYLCIEFGTYGPLRMLRALRLENQAWQSGERPDQVVKMMKERFCPSSPRWRVTVCDKFWNVVRRTVYDSR